MKFSLVVVTRGNRPEELAKLRASLDKQTFRDFELILVDHREHPEFGGNAGAARNFGIAQAKGEVIGFPDDDCWYEPDTLEKAAARFAGDSGLEGLVGKWKSCKSEKINLRNVLYQAGTCFYFLKRAAVNRVGGFDELMGPAPNIKFGGGEDSDLLIRVLKSGGRIERDAEVVIRHPDMPPGDRQKVMAYGVARMHLLAKHHYPLWFRLANVIYPLRKFNFDMFLGRLRGFCS